jgi:hypothetical protein
MGIDAKGFEVKYILIVAALLAVVIGVPLYNLGAAKLQGDGRAFNACDKEGATTIETIEKVEKCARRK